MRDQYGTNNPTYKHGMSKTKVFKAWLSMKSRCLNKNDTSYSYYGERGIVICDRWLDNFIEFYKDMGDPPTKDHSLDRIEVNKGYYKENCKWSTKSEQVNNRRDLKYRKNGKTKVKGICPYKDGKRFRVYLKGNHLGLVDSIEQGIELLKKFGN